LYAFWKPKTVIIITILQSVVVLISRPVTLLDAPLCAVGVLTIDEPIHVLIPAPVYTIFLAFCEVLTFKIRTTFESVPVLIAPPATIFNAGVSGLAVDIITICGSVAVVVPAVPATPISFDPPRMVTGVIGCTVPSDFHPPWGRAAGNRFACSDAIPVLVRIKYGPFVFVYRSIAIVIDSIAVVEQWTWDAGFGRVGLARRRAVPLGGASRASKDQDTG
jgi:hypothetical protein